MTRPTHLFLVHSDSDPDSDETATIYGVYSSLELAEDAERVAAKSGVCPEITEMPLDEPLECVLLLRVELLPDGREIRRRVRSSRVAPQNSPRIQSKGFLADWQYAGGGRMVKIAIGESEVSYRLAGDAARGLLEKRGPVTDMWRHATAYEMRTAAAFSRRQLTWQERVFLYRTERAQPMDAATT